MLKLTAAAAADALTAVLFSSRYVFGEAEQFRDSNRSRIDGQHSDGDLQHRRRRRRRWWWSLFPPSAAAAAF